MKKSFQVHWAASAESDLLGIIRHIADDSLPTASDILAKIQSRAASLGHSPMRGRVVPELLRQGIASYRELILDPWRITYKVEGEKVFVLSVVDSRRNVEDLLLARLLR